MTDPMKDLAEAIKPLAKRLRKLETFSTDFVSSHASQHMSGGTDPIRLDELKVPNDNTVLNATSLLHGLLPKLSGLSTDFFTGAGTYIPGVEALTTNRTYYVSASGNDSNDGLSSSAGRAFLTINHAIFVISNNINTRGYAITISVSNGAYSEDVVCKNINGCGAVYITGNTTTPNNCVLDGGFYKTGSGTLYIIQGFKLIKTTSALVTAITAMNGAWLQVGNMNFSTGWTYHMYSAYAGSSITVIDVYTVSGGCTRHVYSFLQGTIICQNLVITISGSLSITHWSYSNILSIQYLTGNSYSGSATVTGTKYLVSYNSVCYSGVTLPGNTSGSVNTGGIYV